MSELFSITKDNKAKRIARVGEKYVESEIEDFIHQNGEVLLGKKLLFIGKQVITETGKRIDLLAVDEYGSLMVIELKKGFAPRDMMAQILDYSAWLDKLSEHQIEDIARSYFNKYNMPYSSLTDAFKATFNNTNAFIGGRIINILFAQDFPQDLINSVQYLVKNGTPIYCIKFDYYEHPSLGLFLLTQNITDVLPDSEEYDAISTLKEPKLDQATLSKKRNYRKLIENLSDFLDEKYGDWIESFDYELELKWKVYQRQNVGITSVRVLWKVGSDHFNFAFAIYTPQNDLVQRIKEVSNDGFMARFLFGDFVFLEKRNVLRKYLTCRGYLESKSSKNYPYFIKFFVDEKGLSNVDLNFEVIKHLAVEEMDNLKPLFELLFSK